MGILASKTQPPRPPTVPTDTIVPFHYYDDAKHSIGLCFDLTFRFDDLLDDEKLRVALSQLLELGDWRKLGARIRRNDAGALEYHVPQHFDDSRPGFAWSTATHDLAICEHAHASHLVQPHSLATIGHPVAFRVPSYAESPGFKSFIRSPGFPERLDDWLHSDSPQLGVHVIRFKDATLITLSYLHSLTDTMGLSAILDAWTAIVRGEKDQVKPFLGFLDDPLGRLSQIPAQPQVKYRFAKMLLTGWRWSLFCVRYYLSIEMFWQRREADRIIFLPARHLDRMRKEVMDDLANHAPIEGDKVPFVSEGDIIFAWWTRIVMRAEKLSPNRLVSIRNTCDCRSLLQELGLIPPTASALMTNAVFGSFVFLKARQLLDQSLAVTASLIRAALIQQRKAEQLQALDAIRKDCLDNRRHPAIFGQPNMLMFMISNWEKAKLFRVDFSAAVAGQGLSLQERNNQLGRPSSVTGIATRHFATRNTGVVIGKDAGGNYWLAYSLRKAAWLAVEQDLLSMLEERKDE